MRGPKWPPKPPTFGAPGHSRVAPVNPSILRQALDLQGRRLFARDSGAPHVARLALVVAAHAMHHLPVVPHDEIPGAPPGDVDEPGLGGVLGDLPHENAHRRPR